ncbi:CRISPR-associated endonuclease Cas2 [Streptomyces sp. DSM 41014]|uniref:CRISPR-associated endoribonuclease Cas2 n=1 Tax=Streptomyces hintoniae TaxID=3075521 RepID=A0ABU2US74_9ACTN|nr:CRISPR-associated endonuclease Cas2 [Streptomyces sp. DSM 41014]MDT0475662.1 CRISPR-associated endonuclease Cas2 [Streptomyces sp. DSM 41014]
MILVYDTAVERNPKVLKTCRKYLHWTQRSVFHGELSTAQYRALMAALKTTIDQDYDSIVTYTVRSPDMIETSTIGIDLGGPGDII